MNYTFYTLTLLYHLSNIEKLTICFIAVIILTLTIDRIASGVKKQKNKKMLKHYLFIKHNKWSDLTDLLTSNNSLTPSDIHTRLEVDLSIFDSKYRDILYHELIKIKQSREVNPTNWKILINLLYNKPENLSKF